MKKSYKSNLNKIKIKYLKLKYQKMLKDQLEKVKKKMIIDDLFIYKFNS